MLFREFSHWNNTDFNYKGFCYFYFERVHRIKEFKYDFPCSLAAEAVANEHSRLFQDFRADQPDNRDTDKCVCASMYDREDVCVCVLARRAAPSRRCGLWFVINNLYTPPTRCWLAGPVALQSLLSLSRFHHPWKHTHTKKKVQTHTQPPLTNIYCIFYCSLSQQHWD